MLMYNKQGDEILVNKEQMPIMKKAGFLTSPPKAVEKTETVKDLKDMDKNELLAFANANKLNVKVDDPAPELRKSITEAMKAKAE